MGVRVFVRHKRRRKNGQAMAEFALMVPFLLLFVMGTYDLGSWVAQTSSLRAQARAGVREAARGANVDVGDAIRKEGATAIPNTAAAWGTEAYLGTQATCSSYNSACGDAQGCTSSSSFWTTYGSGATQYPIACFAVTHCTLTPPTNPLTTSSSATCPLGSWQTRPPGGTAGDMVVIVVTHKFSPVTPLLASVTGTTVYARYQVESETSY
jgi:Flp pilus assembly protein TadG